MVSQESGRNQEAKEAAHSRKTKPAQALSSSKQDKPMDKFNTAMKKILSVSKKDLKQK